MSALVTDIRQLRKRRVVATTQPVISPDQVPISFEPTERASPLEAVLSRLNVAYPVLKLLIDTLDLEPVAVSLPPEHARLWELAGKSLQGGIIYSRAETIAAISQRTAVTIERAERGFELMVDSHAIEPITDALTGQPHTDFFYLGGSTPF